VSLSDRDLAVAAVDEFWATFGNNESIDPRVRVMVLRDLEEALEQLETDSTRMEGRGRLTSFLFNSRLRAASET